MAEESIFLSAGDPSGDNATAKVIESLLAKKNVTIFGLGGKRLKQLGQIQLANPEDLAVIGFWEVAKQYFFFRRLFNQCLAEIKKRKPKLIVLVDYPGFNLRLAKKLKDLDIPIVYYISPQLWAWGKKRIEQVQKYIDLMIPVLPFEEHFYKDSGVNVKYVGHYLLEDIPKEYIASPAPQVGHLALLPGSRRQEIERMLPTMLETAKLM
ncbi:MAG: lipid-A-disaccharide synthase, partial [Calditrichaeota bacterium]